MRTIERSTKFKRDYKRVSRGPTDASLEASLIAILTKLINDEPLEPKYRDHPLSGEWAGHRDCHIRPDLVLIYAKREGVLRLERLGSHSELFD